MSKESGAGGSGLLSKVVKFVKSPTTHWADLDRIEAEDSSNSESRLALKEMIERKRRNDFVRNREFDMLRKVRRRESVSSADLAGGPSFYPSSQPANSGERARTLKKIDEIEAQMSTTWFKRNGSPDAPMPEQVSLVRAQRTGSQAYQRTDPTPIPTGADDAFAEPLAPPQAFAPTLTMDQALPPAPAASAPAPAPLDESFNFDMSPVSSPAPAILHSGPATSAPAPMAPAAKPRLLGDIPEFNVEVLAATRQDPEIEEAAILYANGDAASAESVLLALIAPGGSRHEDVDTWLTLFDLYRCIGDPVKFDDVAWDFAGLFGRSAPQWALMSEVVSAPAPIHAAAAMGTGAFDWVSPSVIGIQSVAALRASLQRHASPWRINWQHVKTIEPPALEVLTEVFRQWADSTVELRFMHVEHLLEVLAAQSPTDDRSADPQWWGARLALLRVLGEADEFELVALNYCVTYEVSPPAWETPRNRSRTLDDEGQTLPPPSETMPPSAPLTQPFAATDLARPGDLEPGVFKAKLEGEYVGSADAALALVKDHTSASAIELNCRQLLRVDFGAAGDLLNWSLAQQALGCQVSFKQVNRLVAAFFGVIGITDAARVLLRTD